jgi:hypothetical protein
LAARSVPMRQPAEAVDRITVSPSERQHMLTPAK